MKLHDLQVGQRFTFTNKHRGKVFEVTQRATRAVHYTDTATGDERMATDSAKAFCMDVELATSNRLLWAGWISADKKPIPEKDVLICTTDNYIGIGWYYDDSKEWDFECDKYRSDHSGIVAYWCDLPACP